MKKFITLLISAMIIVCCAACGNNGSSSSESPTFNADIANAGLISLVVNTEGMGEIAIADEGETTTFDKDTSVQSAMKSVEKDTVLEIAAKADEGWKFVKWTKDGQNFSGDEHITVTVTADTVYQAVFEQK